MTREEAIRMLRYNSNVIHKTINRETDPNEVEALDMAIKALEQKSCNDVVSRQAVLDTLNKMDKALDDNRSVESYKKLLTECYKDLPSATLNEKTGEWDVYMSEEGKSRTCTCKLCGYKTGPYTWKNPKYCAGCGARMVSE